MRVIGLTGGIGTGKSEVAATLAELGATVIDADAEGHLTYRRGSVGWQRVVDLFGESVLDEAGEVDRAKLGSLVFADAQALAALNAAVHPLIRERVAARLAELAEGSTEVAVVDAAVLYQAGWNDLTDEVWVVAAPAQAVADRLGAQRGMEQAAVRRRLEAQGDPAPLTTRADVVIDNTGSLEQLRARVMQLWVERILSGRQ